MKLTALDESLIKQTQLLKEQFGQISNLLLMRKFKITSEKATQIINIVSKNERKECKRK